MVTGQASQHRFEDGRNPLMWFGNHVLTAPLTEGMTSGYVNLIGNETGFDNKPFWIRLPILPLGN